MGLISRLKCSFKRILEKNLRNFSLRRLSFVCCWLNIYQSALFFRNLPCPEKFLVTCVRKFDGKSFLNLHNKHLWKALTSQHWKIVHKKTDEWCIEWQRVTTSGTTSDNKWQDPLTKKPKENNHHWELYKGPYHQQSWRDIYTNRLKDNSITEDPQEF